MLNEPLLAFLKAILVMSNGKLRSIFVAFMIDSTYLSMLIHVCLSLVLKTFVFCFDISLHVVFDCLDYVTYMSYLEESEKE